MLMHVRIRENVYLYSEFKTDWCEYPISKKDFCRQFNLDKDACDFYGDDGELITGDILECEQVTVLQRPTGVTGAIVLGVASLAVGVGSIVYAKQQQKRAEELAKRRSSLASVYSYSLRGSTNEQRQYSPIPVVLGKVNAAGE